MHYEECNYPIKYGFMALPYVSGRDGFGSRVYDAWAYVVMPCYVIRESKVYCHDGKHKNEFEVVFVKDNMNLFMRNDDQVPEYNFEGACLNSVVLKENQIFDDYELAKALVTEINFEHVCSRLGYLDLKTYHEQCDKDFAKLDEIYEKIEAEFFDDEKGFVYRKKL